MGTLAFSQALDLNNIDDSSYHKYSMLAYKFLYYYYVQMRRTFCMRYTLVGTVCITICYLSLQESIVEQYLMPNSPIYWRMTNVTIDHSHSMSSTIRPFRWDPLRPCHGTRCTRSFCLSGKGKRETKNEFY